MKILLIGCGQTGGAIAYNLLKINELTEISLYSRTIKSAKALAFDLNNPKAKPIENLEEIKKFDYIIIALSGISDSDRKKSMHNRKTSYEVRQDELKYNLGGVAGLVPYLKKADDKTRILVVTNPVDEIANCLRIMLQNEKVYGFGLELDCNRYSRILNKNLVCVGTHGKAIPIINSNSKKEYDDLYKESDSRLMEYLRKYGMTSKETGETFLKFFSKFTSKKEEHLHISYYLKNSFAGVKGISVSLPCIVKEGKVLRIADVKLNEIEKERFQKSAKELEKSIKHIITTHKKLISYK